MRKRGEPGDRGHGHMRLQRGGGTRRKPAACVAGMTWAGSSASIGS